MHWTEILAAAADPEYWGPKQLRTSESLGEGGPLLRAIVDFHRLRPEADFAAASDRARDKLQNRLAHHHWAHLSAAEGAAAEAELDVYLDHYECRLEDGWVCDPASVGRTHALHVPRYAGHDYYVMGRVLRVDRRPRPVVRQVGQPKRPDRSGEGVVWTDVRELPAGYDALPGFPFLALVQEAASRGRGHYRRLSRHYDKMSVGVLDLGSGRERVRHYGEDDLTQALAVQRRLIHALGLAVSGRDPEGIPAAGTVLEPGRVGSGDPPLFPG